MPRNPEFQRNAWLELGGHRLVAMPLVIGIICLSVYVVRDRGADYAVAIAAAALFIAITGFWGAKLAGDAVTSEIRDRTWDWQRMSSIDPWTMAWGKLAGSTVYAWYGGLICLVVYTVFAIPSQGTANTAKMVALLATGALTVQAWSLLLSLILIREAGRVDRRGGVGFFLLVLLLLFAVPGVFGERSAGAVSWYGQPYAWLDFALLSVAALLFWSVVGVYRLIRVELQFRAMPWVWLAFVLFAMVYVGGFPFAAADQRPPAYAIALGATLVMALLAPKDPVAWRGLARAVAAAAWRRGAELLPRWLVTLAVAIGLAVWLLADPPPFAAWLPVRFVNPPYLVVASLLLLVRDVGIVLWTGIGEHAGRPELRAVIYLMLLYTVIPATLAGIGLGGWVVAFWPRPGASFGLGVGALLAEVAGVYLLVYLRWHTRFGRVAEAGAR